MRFKSIQSSVALMAGASILAVIVALVLYALFAGGVPRPRCKSAPKRCSKQ